MGQILFSGLELGVRPGRVMIPRPATEGLVAEALERLGAGPARMADVGTGSGAIAIAIADGAPQAEVWATDTSLAAVSLARANARRHGVADRVTVCHADLLEGVPGPLDLVVANLPYCRKPGRTSSPSSPPSRPLPSSPTATASTPIGGCSPRAPRVYARTARWSSSSTGRSWPPSALSSGSCRPRSRSERGKRPPGSPLDGLDGLPLEPARPLLGGLGLTIAGRR